MNSSHLNGTAVGKASLLALLAALLCFASVPAHAPAAGCPNEAIRESQTSEGFPLGTTGLPSCMALEMVTPPKKFGQETLTLNAFSSDGERALFVSKAALAGTEGLMHFGGDGYVANRGIGGWAASPTSPPRSADISGGGLHAGGPFAFGPDLDEWALLGADQVQWFGGKTQLFKGAVGGALSPLSPDLAPIDNSGQEELPVIAAAGAFGFQPDGTTSDLSASVFHAGSPAVAYLTQDPRETKGSTNSYLAFRNASGQPTLQLLARDETGKVWGGRCGAFLGGAGGGLNQGAISPDGSRIYFTTRPAQAFDPTHPAEEPSPACNPDDPSRPLRIMVRSGGGPQIQELLPGEPEAPGDDLFQAASIDGSRVFLTSPRNLTASDQDSSAESCSATVGTSKGCDLYLYDEDLPEGSRLIQASAGEDVPGEHEAGKGADVLSPISAVSADGSHAYFAAQGVLTADPNPEGETATAGQPNLYLYERDAAHPGGHTAFIGTLSPQDRKGTVDGAGAFHTWGGEASLASGAPYPVPLSNEGDGHVLFFLSNAELTEEDEDGSFTDVYRYDSSGAGTLQCVSCAPGGDASAGDVVGAGSGDASTVSNYAELGRWASDDGQAAAFATAAPLAPGDEGSGVNAYLWKDGRLTELPVQIGDPYRPYKFPTVSPSGNQVGFTTTDALLPVDGDSAKDAYVARVDGGFPNPTVTPVCDPLSEGACQGSGTTPSGAPASATSSFSGPGNPKASKCRNGYARKQSKCVKRKSRKQGKAKHKSKKRASHKHGGSK